MPLRADAAGPGEGLLAVLPGVGAWAASRTDEPRWISRYGNYFVQVVVIYLFSCLSFAWFGARLRQLAVAR